MSALSSTPSLKRTPSLVSFSISTPCLILTLPSAMSREHPTSM